MFIFLFKNFFHVASFVFNSSKEIFIVVVDGRRVLVWFVFVVLVFGKGTDIYEKNG